MFARNTDWLTQQVNRLHERVSQLEDRTGASGGEPANDAFATMLLENLESLTLGASLEEEFRAVQRKISRKSAYGRIAKRLHISPKTAEALIERSGL